MLDSDIAKGIVKRELEMGYYKRIVPGPADNSIWDVENNNSTAATMAKPVQIDGVMYPGVTWARSDKSSGSRVRGWLQMREYLHAARPNPERVGAREKPALFVFDTCNQFMDLVPSLPRDEDNLDDVDTDAEDHMGDEVRYRVLGEALRTGVGRTTGT